MQAGGQHLGGEDAPVGGVVPEAGDRPGLVVVVPVQAPPGLSLQIQLPFVQDLTNDGHAGLSVVPFPDNFLIRRRAVGVLEVEDHVQLRAVRRGVFFCLVDVDAGGFADRQEVVF